MAIQVEGNSDLGMAEPLAGDLGMDAGAQPVGGVAMPQIVKADPLQSVGRNEIGEGVGEGVRLQRRAIGLGHDMLVCGNPYPETE